MFLVERVWKWGGFLRVVQCSHVSQINVFPLTAGRYRFAPIVLTAVSELCITNVMQESAKLSQFFVNC